MGVFFGTDGIRGIVGEDLTYSLATKCGQAIAKLKPGCKVLIGRDTRVSGAAISQSVSLGLVLGGASVVDIAIASSPCVAYLTNILSYDFGVVISASHNPSQHNGIKVFDSTGQKISDKQELQIEKYMVKDLAADYNNLGKYVFKPSLINQYINYLCGLVDGLQHLNIAVDCANGASRSIAKKVFNKLGVKVKFICVGDGSKINDKCGATYPQKLARVVQKHGLDYGFCFDGDADRIVMVGSSGEIYSGDNILYCLASNKNIFSANSVVGTSLTNLGLEMALNNKNIKLERADVGDKYVIEKMHATKSNLGGEQSGHVIVSNLLPTGDGLLVALLICQIIGNNNPHKFMHFEAFPQVMINVSTPDKIRAMGNEELSKAINYATEELSGMGRVFVRPSGTEQKIRVMVEAQNLERAQTLAKYIASKII